MSLDLYQLAVRPLLFDVLHADPELVHRRSLDFLAKIDRGTIPLANSMKASWQQWLCLEDPRLHQNLWGLSFLGCLM